MTTRINSVLQQTTPLKLNRLLQLCSANLPVGGFSFSQGLEYAIDSGWINNDKETYDWVALTLTQAIAPTDLAVIKRLYCALQNNNFDEFNQWNQLLIATRESNEFRLADLAMGKALVRLLTLLTSVDTDQYQAILVQKNVSFVSAFTVAAHLFELDLHYAQSGFCWTYIDNQVAAATKLVPLGQTQSQNLLFELTEQVERAMHIANELPDDEIGASLPHLAMASAWHETQYTRLFRS
ncbi:urease accessory protein UreF [Colwellia sp. 39_35_sub15_T18]|nr:urease accessory protein UreF [Colwellia sp. 39_35_sub15_T18]